LTTDTEPEASVESQELAGYSERESQPANWFRPGDPRASEAGKLGGRPRKGQSAQDKLRAQTDRRADKIIDGVISQAERGNVRAFVSIWDRVYGVPASKLIVEQADSPASELLMRMLAAGGISPRSSAALAQVSQQMIDTPVVIDQTDT
jgi:hypothetical protein